MATASNASGDVFEVPMDPLPCAGGASSPWCLQSCGLSARNAVQRATIPPSLRTVVMCQRGRFHDTPLLSFPCAQLCLAVPPRQVGVRVVMAPGKRWQGVGSIHRVHENGTTCAVKWDSGRSVWIVLCELRGPAILTCR